MDYYGVAQRAMADLKAAVRYLLLQHPGGLTNAQIGRALGIYSGHVGHEGHVSRTVLGMLQAEGVAVQDAKTKRWSLRDLDNSVDE